MQRAILFDMDGVLLDSREAWYRALLRVAQEWGCPAPGRQAFVAGFGQSVEADARQFFPGRTPAELAAAYSRHFPAALGRVRAMPGAGGVLAEVAAHGLACAVVTNTPLELARAMLTAAGLEVGVVVGDDGRLAPKPAADLVEAALSRLGLTPTQALLVGDSEFDRAAAGAAGVRFVGLGIEGDPRIDSLAELTTLLAR